MASDIDTFAETSHARRRLESSRKARRLSRFALRNFRKATAHARADRRTRTAPV